MSTGGLGTVLRLVGIGWYVAICIAGGVLGGFYLDSRLDTSPVLTLLGLALGDHAGGCRPVQDAHGCFHYRI